MNDGKDTKNRLGKINSIGLLVSFLLMALLFWLIAMVFAPPFKSVMLGVGEELPQLSIYLLNGRFFWPLYILVAIAIIKEPYVTSKPLSCTINWFFIWTIPIYVCFFILALYGPIFVLLRNIRSTF